MSLQGVGGDAQEERDPAGSQSPPTPVALASPHLCGQGRLCPLPSALRPLTSALYAVGGAVPVAAPAGLGGSRLGCSIPRVGCVCQPTSEPPEEPVSPAG